MKTFTQTFLDESLELIRKLGGKVVGASFAVELTFLNGRVRLPGIDVFTMIQYDQ